MPDKTSRPAKDEASVLEAIAAMPKADREIAERLHEIVTSTAPELQPRLWYGQPAYARDGKVIVFVRGAEVDGERYLTLGFSGAAKVDEGNVRPTAYAVTKLTRADEAMIGDLVKRAVA